MRKRKHRHTHTLQVGRDTLTGWAERASEHPETDDRTTSAEIRTVTHTELPVVLPEEKEATTGAILRSSMPDTRRQSASRRSRRIRFGYDTSLTLPRAHFTPTRGADFRGIFEVSPHTSIEILVGFSRSAWQNEFPTWVRDVKDRDEWLNSTKTVTLEQNLMKLGAGVRYILQPQRPFSLLLGMMGGVTKISNSSPDNWFHIYEAGLSKGSSLFLEPRTGLLMQSDTIPGLAIDVSLRLPFYTAGRKTRFRQALSVGITYGVR